MELESVGLLFRVTLVGLTLIWASFSLIRVFESFSVGQYSINNFFSAIAGAVFCVSLVLWLVNRS